MQEIPFGERLLQQQSGAISRLQFAGGPTADASLVSRWVALFFSVILKPQAVGERLL